ncbi:MAG: hypothetical protein ACOCXA_06895 [Planctomycetota bacterium]
MKPPDIPRQNFDDRTFATEPGQPDVYIPRHFLPKLGLALFSLAIFAFGIWMSWDPVARLLTGEISQARVVHIVRTQPGVPDEVIRYARSIEEQPYTVTFQHYVAVEDEEGKEHVMRLGVDSAKKPYAKVNDVLSVTHYEGDEYAFALYHHRTWAFGAGFLSVGAILSLLALHTLWAVGKPIIIDPESAEALEAERQAQEADREWEQQQKQAKQEAKQKKQEAKQKKQEAKQKKQEAKQKKQEAKQQKKAKRAG